MNSKIKGIIVCGVFIVCLVVVAVALKLSGNFDKEDDGSSSDEGFSAVTETIPLVDMDSAQVTHILIENEYGETNFEQNGVGEEEWTVTELEGLSQSDTAVSATVNIASGLTAQEIAEENPSDLSKYGLSEPVSRFTVEFSDYDRTTRTFLIGNETPEGDCRYVCEEGVNTIYTVKSASLTYFLSKPEYFVTLVLMATPDDDSWPEIVDLTVERQDLDYVISFRTEEDQTEGLMSAQVMYEPIYMSLNITNSTDVTHGMWGLTAEDTIIANPGEDDLAQYGLDDPGTTVTLKTDDDKTHVLTIGDPIYVQDENGNDTAQIASYYVYLTGEEGINSIYQVAADSLPWTTFLPEDVISNLMTTNAVGTVDTIVYENESGSSVFEIDTDDEGSVTKVTLDGEEVDANLFKTLYQQIITCPTNQVYFEDTDAEPFATLSINVNDGKSDVIEFIRDTNRRVIVKLNGRTTFRIASTWIDSLEDNIENVRNGTEVKDFV